MIFRFLSGGLRFLIILEFWILIILMDTVKLDTYYFDGSIARSDGYGKIETLFIFNMNRNNQQYDIYNQQYNSSRPR